MAISMNLRDLTNPQYTAVTGRKSVNPYTAYLTAMGPSVRADALREKETLQGKTQFDAGQALTREQMEIAKSQNKKATELSMISTGIAATSLANQAGLINVKDLAGNAGTGVKTLFQTAAQKAAEEAAAQQAAEAMLASEAGGAGGTAVGSLAGGEAAADVTAAQAAEAMYASEAGGAGGTSSTASAGAGNAVGATVGRVGGVLAIIAAANAARDAWGGTKKEYADRTAGEKVFSDPGLGFGASVSEIAGKEFARIPNQVGKNFDRFAGNPISKAFKGDFSGAMDELSTAVPDTLRDIGVDEKTSKTLGNVLTPPTGQFFSGLKEGGVGEGIRNVLDPIGITKGCIIVTACTSPDSEEVNISREYRDKFLTPEQLRGYYMIAEKMVPWIQRFPPVKWLVKRLLVDNLIAYGRYALDKGPYPGPLAHTVTKQFLRLCGFVGSRRRHFVRCNGETV